MTAPQIGNYGIAAADHESGAPQVAGLRHARPVADCQQLAVADDPARVSDAQGIVAIGDIDTRALTRKLRSGGVHARRHRDRARRSTPTSSSPARVPIPNMEGADLVKDVTCAVAYDFVPIAGRHGRRGELRRRAAEARAPRTLRVAAYDFGIKTNILRRLAAHGCDVRVFPASAPATELLASNRTASSSATAPAIRRPSSYAIDNVRTLVDSADRPIFGICLGHQLLGLALGAETYKLKFGHRGANHPVKQLDSSTIEITSQNHGFAVDPDTLPAHARVTHLNLYDGTVEGLRHVDKPIYSVQYHPEASPGPHDADYLFTQFIEEMERR